MKAPATILALLALALLAPAGRGGGAEVSLPVTKVTCFSSGVSYFEHNGKLDGSAEVVLKFKTEQMNDVLMSLVVLDLGGGSVSAVSFPSQEPLARALKSFAIDLAGNPPLAALLEQIRGAEVVLASPEKITGKVVGVETRTRQILPANVLVHQPVLNVLTQEGIKSVPLETVSSVSLADEKLSAELNKALAALSESRDTDRKTVQINFVGQGERAVRIGYVAEAPIWQTSYRLVLGGGKKDTATVQGWAVVENTSDFDWSNVSLTLVSGRPISFIQDLYTPLYVPRPEVQPELYASLRPQVYAEGLAEKAKEVAELRAERRQAGELARARATPGAPPAPTAALAARKPAAEAEQADRAALQRGVQAMAAGVEVGELFSYPIQTPVTLARRKSAMLPIVNQPIQARKVSIYNASVLPRHPLNGLWLTNDTKLVLPAGPATVFDGGTYGGDARIGNLAPKAKRLLSYAIDLDVTVDSSAKSAQRIASASIVQGVLHFSRRYEYTQGYEIKNGAGQDRTVVIEQPRSAQRKLVKPEEPTEQTDELYRFEVSVPDGKTGKLDVVEEQIVGQQIAILPSDVGAFEWFITSGEVPKKVRDALAEAAKRKAALTEAERNVSDLQGQINALNVEQAKLPALMNALDRASQAYKRFEERMMTLQTQIEKLQGELAEARAKVKDLREKLEDYLKNLEVK